MVPSGEAPPGPEDSDPIVYSTASVLILVSILITWLIFGHKIQGMFAWTKWVSEGSMACLMGMVSGVALLIWDATQEKTFRQSLSFDSASFFTYMLPPIIFYGGLAIERKLFVSNFISIMSFGVLGTFVSFSLLIVILYAISQFPYSVLRFSDCLALAAIFAATDSVAVLQVLRPESHPALYSIVLGEGVMNDATSVALLNTVRLLNDNAAFSSGTAIFILLFFIYLFVASCALGLGAGLGIAMVMKRLGPFSEPQEVGLVGALAYTSYLVAELLGLSGILTLFFCGMAVSHYALQHVSKGSRASLLTAFRTLSYLLEGIIFLYVGRDALDPGKWAHAQFLETVYLVIFIVALIAISRALFVFPLAWLHNRWSTQTLYFGDGVAIWWAGMMRGAVSVAMVYYAFDPTNVKQDSHSATIVVTTLQVVLFSTVILGGITGPLLKMVLSQAVKPPNLNGLRGFMTGSSSRSPAWRGRGLRRHLAPHEANSGSFSDFSDTRGRTPLPASSSAATAYGDDESATALRPNNVEMSTRQGPVWTSDASAGNSPNAASDRRPLLGSSYTSSVPKARPPRSIDSHHQRLLSINASMGAPSKSSRGSPLSYQAPSEGSFQTTAHRGDGIQHGRHASSSQHAPRSPPVEGLPGVASSRSTDNLAGMAASVQSQYSQSLGDVHFDAADWDAAASEEEADVEEPARNHVAMPRVAHRVLNAAHEWAARADWDSRPMGADGGLGQAMYSRFKQFDAKYMQPVFGAEGGGTMSSDGSALLPTPAGSLGLPTHVIVAPSNEEIDLLGLPTTPTSLTPPGNP